MELFNDERGKHMPQSKQGRYTVVVGLENFVTIRTLDTGDTTDPRVTFPPGRIDMKTFEPNRSGGDGLWHTDLSSLRLSLDIVKEVQNPSPRPPLVCYSTIPVGSVQPPLISEVPL